MEIVLIPSTNPYAISPKFAMNEQHYSVCFPQTNYGSITLKKNAQLSEHLTIQNSPILFGCRTGICGTWLIVVKGDIPPPSAEEREVLEILAPGENQARLACQIALTNDIEIIPFEEHR